MKQQQSGFTLIELVVVIVILGILAATAIPRFTNLTDEARAAVAEGILGSILSSAVIQFGENDGEEVPFQSIIDNTDISTSERVVIGTPGGDYTKPEGQGQPFSGSPACSADGSDSAINITVANPGSPQATGTLADSLCDN